MTISAYHHKPTSTPDDSAPCGAGGPALVVLDTNVVLDLLVFKDARASALHHSLVRGDLRWVATAAMFDELADVLARPNILRRGADPAAVLDQVRTLVHALVKPAAAAASHGPHSSTRAPRCADPDDQMFIDLAWACSAQWLFSRDRALLALAKPARLRGVRIIAPEAWTQTGCALT